MKELSIEEKAKAYDEAKARMSRAFNSNRCTIGFMNEIFPELKESEDEKIRKELIDIVEKSPITFAFEDKGKVLAWLKNIPYTIDHEKREGFYLGYKAGLEKQGDHKLAWSEEDKEMCQETIDWFEKKCFPYALENDNPARESIKWLKSLKQRLKRRQSK